MELKEILGEELFNQVQEQLKGKGPQGRDVELVATNTGDYVPAEKYETLKNNYNKVSNDYATLNSNYEKLNAQKENDIKRILVEGKLKDANLIQVNKSYDYIMPNIDMTKLVLENGQLIDSDNVIANFISLNPELVKITTVPTTEPTIPASSGVNPPNPQGAIKDKAYYEGMYKQSNSLEQKMAVKREAGNAGIILN